MRFTSFKELKSYQTRSVLEIAKYIAVDLKGFLRDLQVGLTRLQFTDNFQAFESTVTIPASTEISIRNQLVDPPSYRMIVRGGTGAEAVVDGDTEWDENFVYLKNTGLSSVTITVLFFR